MLNVVGWYGGAERRVLNQQHRSYIENHVKYGMLTTQTPDDVITSM